MAEIKWATAQSANKNCAKKTHIYKFVVQMGADEKTLANSI
jgi:hypothetical protein|tara:strand:- start:305 stop:427 length:123 start_codon:yes stop_codon:yes gene_type:complete